MHANNETYPTINASFDLINQARYDTRDVGKNDCITAKYTTFGNLIQFIFKTKYVYWTFGTVYGTVINTSCFSRSIIF